HLDVGVGQLAAHRAQQEVVHGLVHPPTLGDEPEVDRAEAGQDLAVDAGLFLYFADRGLLGRLAGLDVPLGQGPQQPTTSVDPADHRPAGPVAVQVDNQTAGARLVDALELDPPGPSLPGPSRLAARAPWRVGASGHAPMVAAGRYGGLAMS